MSIFACPKDPERCKKWILNSRRKDLLPVDVSYCCKNIGVLLQPFWSRNVHEQQKKVLSSMQFQLCLMFPILHVLWQQDGKFTGGIFQEKKRFIRISCSNWRPPWITSRGPVIWRRRRRRRPSPWKCSRSKECWNQRRMQLGICKKIWQNWTTSQQSSFCTGDHQISSASSQQKWSPCPVNTTH